MLPAWVKWGRGGMSVETHKEELFYTAFKLLKFELCKRNVYSNKFYKWTPQLGYIEFD